MKVALEKIDGELRKLWEAQGPKPRSRTMTLVALCETEEHEPIALRGLSTAAPLHNARAVLVGCRPGAEPSITAEIELLDGPQGPAAELIRLQAIGDARAWIPDTVSRMISADLPVFVWWIGDLPDHETLFDRMAFGAQATIAVVNSNEMDLRDLPVLDSMARGALADFTWQRLRYWQEMVARFFDVKECASDLEKLRSLHVCFQQRAKDPERASNQAALFIGWLSARLGWSSPRWSDAKVTLSSKAGDVEITFEGAHRDGLADGALVAVELRTADARYRVHRPDDDPLAICWEGERPGTPFPNQCVRVHPPDDGVLLCRVLERPLR
ncbi:MAG: glucose-6-phosphate dehydrogenase assembly protein OpcA, partial [Polyangiales bacterium]